MIKSFKFQLSPTKSQKELLEKHFGCRRFVWNYFLNKRKEEYLNNKKTLNYYDCSKELTKLKKEEKYNWLNDVNSQSLQQSLKDLDLAYNSFFRKSSKFPNFKSKHEKQSFRVPQRFSIEDGKLYIPKFQDGISINTHREFGKINNITISKSSTNKYFASLICEVGEIKKLKQNDNKIGIDLGIKDFAVCSNGNRFANPKHYNKVEKKLKFNQRNLSKSIIGSKSRDNKKKKVAVLHERIVNSRTDFLHKLSKKLIDENQVICVEDLDIKGMMRDNKFSKHISLSGWGEFIRQLMYKAEWYGRTIVKIDRYFPSSKACNSCRHINESLKLKDRNWNCPCGKKIDRDLNASLNILQQGLNIITGSGAESVTKQKRVESLPIGKAVKPEANQV